MSQEQKRRPQDGRAWAEMILQVACGSANGGLGEAVFVHAGVAKAWVGILVVTREIETVLDERRANESVVANAIAADPGIEEWQREKEEQQEQALRLAEALWTRRTEVL